MFSGRRGAADWPVSVIPGGVWFIPGGYELALRPGNRRLYQCASSSLLLPDLFCTDLIILYVYKNMQKTDPGPVQFRLFLI